MTKRILCLALAAVLTFGLFACNGKKPAASGEEKNSTVNTKLREGAPSSHGDKFDAPKIEQSANGPIIAEISKQALPDDSITLAGQGFSDSSLKAYVYALDQDGKAQTKEAKFTVTNDQTLSVLIDKDFAFGVYGVYLETSNGTSAMEYVNLPAIWDVGMTRLTAGDTFNIYGENLTTDLGNKVRVYLVNGKEYCEVEVTYADPYKISFKVPAGLKNATEYEVKIHTGHGGDLGFATVPKNLLYFAEDPDAFNGKVIDVTNFDIDPTVVTTEVDASLAIQAAIDSANDGDIIYLPSGVYFCKSNIHVTKSVKFAGNGKDHTFIVTGNNLEDALFMVEIGHVEFTNMTFRHVRGSGLIRSGFIYYRGDLTDTGIFNLYVHDCHFLQSIPVTAKGYIPPINLRDVSNAIVDNNTFDTCCTVWAQGCNKVAVTNNDAKCGFYVGAYYGQNSSYYTSVNNLDISNNTYIGKDHETDSTGILDDNDQTVGRWVVIQGSSSNHYIANNTVKATGLPGGGYGEVVLYENVHPQYVGAILSADATTITLPQNSGYIGAKGNIVSITDGKGLGQYAFVSHSVKNVVHLQTPLTVIPDSTSNIIISANFYNSAVYKNFFSGYTNYIDGQISDGTCGISVYGGMHNLFFVDNYGEYLPQGICITPFIDVTENRQCVVFWSQFDRNEFFNTSLGIKCLTGIYAQTSAITQKGNHTFGLTARRNSFDTVKKYVKDPSTGGQGVTIGYFYSTTSPSSADLFFGLLLEHNTFKNSDYNDIITYPNSGGLLLRGNKNADEGSDGTLKVDNTYGKKLTYLDY